MKLPMFITKRRANTTKAITANPSKPTMAGFIKATVKPEENGSLQYRTNANFVLSQYISGIAADAGMFNASNLASVPLRLFRVVKDGEIATKAVSMAERSGQIVEVVDHPVLDLLKHPDKFATASEWASARWADKQWFGACYFLKVIDEETGRMWLQRMMPAYVTPQPDKFGYISEYHYGRDMGSRQTYTADQVIVLKMAAHPHDPFRGLGWLELCIREIKIENEALSAELARWENGGYPSGVLAFDDPLDEEQMQEAIDKFQQYYAGSTKAGLPIITSRSTFTPLSEAKDMGYQQGLDIVEARVLNRAGIPLPLYRMDDSNLASSKSAHAAYARYTLKPMLSLDAEQLTELLLPLFDLDPNEYFFLYDEVVPEDKETLRNDILAYVQSGVMTKNEARSELDLGPLEEQEDKPTEQPLYFLPPAGLLEDTE